MKGADSMKTFISGISAEVNRNDYVILGYVAMHNGCCSDKAVVVTMSRETNHPVYSCQCACGGWCTNGFENISEAVADYERMNENYTVR